MKKALVFAALGLAVAVLVVGQNSAKAGHCHSGYGYGAYYGGGYGGGYGGVYGGGAYYNSSPNYGYAPSHRYNYQSYYRPRYNSGYVYRGYRGSNAGYSAPYSRANYYGSAGYGSQFNFYNPGLIGN